MYSNATNGAQMALYHYDEQSNQKFHIVSVGKDTYTLSPVSCPGSCISVLPDAKDAGVYVGIWVYSSNPAQQWIISPTPSGYCRISPVSAPQFALTCDRSTQAPLAILKYAVTAIQVKSYTDGQGQEWAIVSAAND